ncbi:MAG: hypothetical protein DMF57_14245 [Acidobacteria bacterium]|nr:MAG: hypothetical protein DMF57_14245 [Acidobacteriota bacterium]
MRIVEPRLVKIDQARADAQPRSASAVAEANIRFACLVRQVRIAHVRKLRPLRDSAALEGAEVLPRLRDLPPRQRKKHRTRSIRDLPRGGRSDRLDRLRVSIAVVALAEKRRLFSQNAVCVGDCSPEDRAGGHRASRHGVDLAGMTSAAGLRRNAKIAGIHESDELVRLFQQRGVRPWRIR